MPESATIHIFHLARKDDKVLFLHTSDGSRLVQALEAGTVRGVYGREPRVESLTELRTRLYGIIESEIRRWIGEKNFLTRFVISAAIFLVSFLVLSFAVPTPIPILDELIFSLVAAGAVYVALGRRDMKSELVLSRRVALRSKLDRVVFEEDSAVHQIEAILDEMEDIGPAAVLSSMDSTDVPVFRDDEIPIAREAVSYLHAMFAKKELRRAERRMARARRKDSVKDVSAIKKKVMNATGDVPLFLSYLKLKTTVAERR